MKYTSTCSAFFIALSSTVSNISVEAFSTHTPPLLSPTLKTQYNNINNNNNNVDTRTSTVVTLMMKKEKKENVFSAILLSAGIMGSAILLPVGNSALADEIGREVEAPTLFTGETTLICTKRGPLGACLKTETRTVENDNDKATKYFKDPQDSMKQKYSAAQLQSIDFGETKKVVLASDGNELIEKLKQQSIDNKDKNDKIVRAKTLQNDMGASFGPLDSQVAILNSDGETFTLLKGAQAMRLKKMGYIKDKRFVTQPTKEVIDAAVEADENGPGAFIGGFMKGILKSDDF